MSVEQFTPSPFVLIALLAWAPLVLAVFYFCGPARIHLAVLFTFIGGVLFLPMAGIPIKSFVPYDKFVACSASALLGILLFDPLHLARFRFRTVDWLMILWVFSPMGAIFFNSESIEAKEGILEVLKHLFLWGIPYFVGRVCFSSYAGLFEVARAIFIGGLIYVPFCLWEIRFSPQLHFQLYGYMQHAFDQTIRLDGYRPMVFMNHGLMVGMWMAAATLSGYWLWKTGAMKKLWGLDIGYWLLLLAGTTLLGRSTGAIVLLGVGIAVMHAAVWSGRAALLLVVLFIPPAYMFARTAGGWTGKSAVETANSIVGRERSDSLKYRMEMEDMLVDKAMQKPLFGWGPAGRSLVRDAYGAQVSIPDGMWVVAIGPLGFFGAIAFFACLFVPVWKFYRKLPTALWSHPRASGAVAMAVVMALYAIDNLLNAHANPIFYLAVGGLAGTFSAPVPTQRRALPQSRNVPTTRPRGQTTTVRPAPPRRMLSAARPVNPPKARS